MRKVTTSNKLTVGMLTNDSNEKVKDFIFSDRGFTLMNGLKGTLAYWKKFLFDVLAMVKQVGVSSCFMTFSSAEMRWNELISMISKLNKQDISDADIEKLSNHDRCKLLNSIPVLVAKHFQYQVEVFFKEIIVDGPSEKVICHAVWVEFQVYGSPHIRCFLWLLNAPTLTADSKKE